MTTISVKSVLADPMHPLHDQVADTIIDLERGALNMCACMGPVYGEPYCPCEMNRRGLPSSPAHVQATAEAEERLAALVASGIFSPDAVPDHSNNDCQTNAKDV